MVKLLTVRQHSLRVQWRGCSPSISKTGAPCSGRGRRSAASLALRTEKPSWIHAEPFCLLWNPSGRAFGRREIG